MKQFRKKILPTEPRCEICLYGCYEGADITYCWLCDKCEHNNHVCSAFEPSYQKFTTTNEDDE